MYIIKSATHCNQIVTYGDIHQQLKMEDERTASEEVCRLLAPLTELVVNRRWTEVGHDLTLISEALSKPENR